MQLITRELREQLLANGENRGEDHFPGLKLFNPVGAATWLITEMDPENNDYLFGLADLGMGFPELGGISLSELQGYRGPLGLGIERDLYFTARYSLVCRPRHTIGYVDENVMPIPSLYVTEQANFSVS